MVVVVVVMVAVMAAVEGTERQGAVLQRVVRALTIVSQ